MRVLHCLLLLGLLSAQMPTGAGLLANLVPKYPEYVCVKKGGTCNFSPCPRGTKIDGSCYRKRAKCCV